VWRDTAEDSGSSGVKAKFHETSYPASSPWLVDDTHDPSDYVAIRWRIIISAEWTEWTGEISCEAFSFRPSFRPSV